MKPKCLIIRENNKFINPLLFVLLFSEYQYIRNKGYARRGIYIRNFRRQ